MRNALTRWRWEQTGNKMKMVDGGNESTRNKKKTQMKEVLRMENMWKSMRHGKENKFSRHNKNTGVQNMKRE